MHPIKVNWLDVRDGRYVVARWRNNGRLILELIDYSIYLSRQCALSNLTVEVTIYNVVRLMSFCRENTLSLVDIDDVKIREFRDSEFVRLRDRICQRGSDKIQKRTVNSRLKSIYNFMFWYQEYRLGSKDLIGPSGCNIRSTINSTAGKSDRNRTPKLLYPLLFPLSGAKSKHRPVKAATGTVKEGMISHFNSLTDDYLASRNTLILDIADTLGMRRASINSLTCTQFFAALENEEALVDLVVVPSSQKFSYQFSYTFPFQLVSSVLQYIEGPRKALLGRLKVPTSVSQDRLFLSSKTGKPLTDRAITGFIASAMRLSGMPKGSIHVFRHKFINDEVEREIMRRIELKLDTSIESIAAAVAIKVGHANPNSLYTYISDAFSRLDKKLPKDNKSKIKYLEKEISELKRQLQLLREATAN
jgi:integrase